MVPLLDSHCCKNLTVVAYESLTENSQLFLGLTESLGLGDSLLTHEVPVRPSATTVGDSNVLRNDNPNLSWQHRLESWEVDEVLNVMDAFGIDFYNESPRCDLSRLRAMGVQKLLG